MVMNRLLEALSAQFTEIMPHMGRKATHDAAKLDLTGQAAYGLTEAARNLKLPASTLRAWLVGRVPQRRAQGQG